MENEKTSNELPYYKLTTGRIVTIVRSPVLPVSDKIDPSYRGERLKVLGHDAGYAIIKLKWPYQQPILLPLSEWGFADASILDKPKMVWITTDEVEREGKKSTLAAVEVSIKKYRQVYEAPDEELRTKSIDIIGRNYCGLCQRFAKSFGNQGCPTCLLKKTQKDGTETCCSEWIACRNAWGNWPVFRPAVLKLIERLEMEREKLLKPPIELRHGDYGFDGGGGFRLVVKLPNGNLCYAYESRCWSLSLEGTAGQLTEKGARRVGNIFDDLRAMKKGKKDC